MRGAFARPACFITRNSKTSPSARRAYSDDSSQQGAKTQTVTTVTSKHELDELVQSASKDGKITVLEVAKQNGKRTAEITSTFASLASSDDFYGKALFAQLTLDRSEATRCAAESLKVEEVPYVFIWNENGEMVTELGSTSADALHHAVSRVLGIRGDDIG